MNKFNRLAILKSDIFLTIKQDFAARSPAIGFGRFMTTYMIVIKLFITLEYLFSDNTDDFYMRVKPHWKVRNSGIDWNGCHDGFRADEELIHFCKILKYDITQISQIFFCPIRCF